MNVARWIGRRAAEVVAFFRDKPFIPCQVEWEPSSVRYWNGGHELSPSADEEECCDKCDAGCWA
jgi:hypothetical protein